LLLQQCQDKNPEDKNGNTPLHSSALNGHLEVTRLLLQHSRDKNPENKNGKTPLHYAEDRGHVDIVELIKRVLKVLKQD
jgi:ankyrin repeat protein